MMLGLAGNGDLVIFICVAICLGMAVVALETPRVLKLVVGLIESIVNGLIQYLLRKIVDARRLQALLDAAHDPKSVLGLAKRPDSSISEEVSKMVRWKADVTCQPDLNHLDRASGATDSFVRGLL